MAKFCAVTDGDVDDGDIVPPDMVPVAPDVVIVICVGLAVATVYTLLFRSGVPVLDVEANVTNEPTGKGGTLVVLLVKLMVTVVAVDVPELTFIEYASILPLFVL